MRRNLLLAALVLLAMGMTGCIIIEAGTLQSRTPTTIRIEQCEIYQNLGDEAPVSMPVE